MSAEFLDRVILGNRVASYLLAITILLGGILLTTLVRTVIIERLKHLARYSATDLDDRLLRILERPFTYLLYLGSFYVSIGNLNLHSILQESITFLCVILATLLVVPLDWSFC